MAFLPDKLARGARVNNIPRANHKTLLLPDKPARGMAFHASKSLKSTPTGLALVVIHQLFTILRAKGPALCLAQPNGLGLPGSI